jgi:hypothetical protein
MSSSCRIVDLRQLSPPQFAGQCALCNMQYKILPWQIRTNDGWGVVCRTCGERLLLELLHSRLPQTFSTNELVLALCQFGLEKRECELFLQDHLKERVILKTEKGFS